MVLGFDNTALLITLTFAAIVLKPAQLKSIGYQCGRTVGWAVGQLASLQRLITESGSSSEFGRIKREVQESLSTLNAIQHEIRRGTQILPDRVHLRQPMQRETVESTEQLATVENTQLPVSAESVGMMETKEKGQRYGSEIVMQSIIEEEVARKAQAFMKTGQPE